MSRLVYSRADQRLYYIHATGYTSFECRNDIWPGVNEQGQPHESLPCGDYACTAEEYPAENAPAYGRTYIETGDPRGRVIHGGGSDLPDSFAPRQGWEATYGCLRLQNEDGETLSRWMIEDGNAVPLTVQDGSYA